MSSLFGFSKSGGEGTPTTLPQKRKSDEVVAVGPPASAFAFAKRSEEADDDGQPKKAKQDHHSTPTMSTPSFQQQQQQSPRFIGRTPYNTPAGGNDTATANNGGQERVGDVIQQIKLFASRNKTTDHNDIMGNKNNDDEKGTEEVPGKSGGRFRITSPRANPFTSARKFDDKGQSITSPTTTQKIFEYEQAKIEASMKQSQLSLWQRFKRLIHVSFWFCVWFTVNNFTKVCIGVLVFMALWPDHYFELDLTPARLLLGIALIHIANTWWAAMPKWFKDYAQGIKDQGPQPSQNQETTAAGGGTSLEAEQNLSRSVYSAANSAASGEGTMTTEQLSSPTTIMAKLQTLFDVTLQQLGEDSSLMPRHKVYVCVLAFLDLLRELYHVKPDWYDIQLRKQGKIPDYFSGTTPSNKNNGKEFWDDLTLYLEMSDLAYQESLTELIAQLRPLGYQLIRQDLATEPGRVGHFIAVNYETMNVVIAIKGTSSVGDVLTDLVGHSVPHELTGEVWKQIRCHEGMYSATKQMLQETTHLVSEFFIPSGYTLTICGHSLGAGVSCLLGIFLKDITGISKEKLKVYAFATPACLSYDAALECQDFVTSVVNNADCVPRASMMNVKTLFKFFLKIDQKLEETGQSPKDWKSSAAFWKEVTSVDSEPLFTVDEIVEFQEDMIRRANETELDGEYALFVPGKVIHMWECNDGSVDCREWHGGLNTLREIQVYPSMITDHGTLEYKKNLRALIEAKTVAGTS